MDAADPTPSIACIGGAHVDRVAQALGEIRMNASNPVRVHGGAGGVARNVAENLARLGAEVTLASRIGADPDGELTCQSLEGLGVNLRLVSRSRTAPTATFTALIDEAGELVVAMADMGVYEEIESWPLSTLISDLETIPVWFVDTNLPEPILARLLEARPEGVQVAVDTVSPAKSLRVRRLLSRVDMLFCNEYEASTLTDSEIRAPLDTVRAGEQLMRAGAGSVVIGRGPAGAYFSDGRDSGFVPARTDHAVDVTGGGDAMIAATLWARGRGKSLGGAVALGQVASALAVECETTVNPALTPALLAEHAAA